MRQSKDQSKDFWPKKSNSLKGKKSWKHCDDAPNFEESSILEPQ
jgi:hypothetical protein